MSDQPAVFLLHAVDTEGPLYESPPETVSRINRSLGLKLPENATTLDRLNRGEIDLGESAAAVKTLLKFSVFLGDWGQVKAMLQRVTAPEFRQRNADSLGNPWAYNWHVMDHVGYNVNPRHRDIGFHNIFDFYRDHLAQFPSRDELGFHFHADHPYHLAHLCGDTYSTSRYLYEILTRKLIDRTWFPRSFRAGFHTERPDSNLFLEQWIPNDFSNQAIERSAEELKQVDLAHHRLGDWTRASREWGAYHPHHDDYQIPGSCRRKIFRCLNIGTRIRCINEVEINKAFEKVARGKTNVFVGVTNHDYRDMTPDVEWLKQTFDTYSKKHDVPWRSATIGDTFEGNETTKSQWKVDARGALHELSIEYDKPIFGPQPFLAIKLNNETYFHQNFDIVEPFKKFSYTFDENTVRWNRIDKIVVGTNDRFGNTVIDRVKDE